MTPDAARLPALEVVSRGDGRGECAVTLAADHPGFRGHFPGAPVFPAMCHVDLALCAAQALAGRPLELARVERARFARPVRPGSALRLQLVWSDVGADADDDADDAGQAVPARRRVVVTHAVDGAVVAELELVLCVPGA